MGLLIEKEILKWNDYKDSIRYYKNIGINSFIDLFNNFNTNKAKPFYWGYEMEYMLIKNISNSKKPDYRLNIKASEVIKKLYKGENCWLPEYANWMVEKIPLIPYNDDNRNLLIDKIYKLDNDKFFEDFNIDKNKYLQKKNTSKYDEEINLTEDIRKVIIKAYELDYKLYNNI